MNTQKTKYLCIGTETETLVTDNKEVSICNEYKYLGTTFNRKGTDDQEINIRITQARRIIAGLNGILWNKNKKEEIKCTKQWLKVYCCTAAKHGDSLERSKRKLEATEMDAIRRSTRMSRRDRIRNEEIKQRMGVEGTIIDDIERKQLVWYGHVQRMDDNTKQIKLSKQIMQWILPGKRRRGRSKKTC